MDIIHIIAYLVILGIAYCAHQIFPSFVTPVIITVVGHLILKMLERLFGERPLIDERKLAEEYHKLRERRKYLKELNDSVLKPWKKVTIYPDEFRLVINMDKLDSDMLNQGKEFLKKENNETRTILKIWNQLESLKDKYNKIGKTIRNAIINHLADAYPSLLGKESRYVVQLKDECYVVNNIINFVERILKPKLLKNEPINWDKIIPEPVPYLDVSPPIWCLEPYDIHIQSKIKNNVNRIYYQNVLKNLILKIISDLKKENELNETINLNLNDFREKMNTLNNAIVLHQVLG